MTHDRVFPRVNGRMSAHQFFAYHFENEKYVRFLESHAQHLGVEIVDDTLIDVGQDENGITSLQFASGRSDSADLYIDCSGFASVLLRRTLQESFLSFA